MDHQNKSVEHQRKRPMQANDLKLFQNVDGVLFDLDGTLWDASATCAKAWNEALLDAGLENYTVDSETIRSFSGLQIESVLQQYFGFVAEHQHAHLVQCYKNKEAALMKEMGGKLYPGVKEVLTELSQLHKLFIVSNCLHSYIENFLWFTGLENLFSDFEASGRTGLSKGENIKRIIERNRLKKPVYIGDTVWDYEAAASNNVPFVFASYGFGKFDEAVCKIHDVTELRYLLTDANRPF